MSGTKRPRAATLALTAGLWAALLAPLPGRGAGFTAAEPGVKAMGLGGAFTAVAVDPTVVYYNPGGLGLLAKGKLTVGAGGLYLNESQFRGTSPGIGAGSAAEQEQQIAFPAHAYAVKALGPKVKVGLGVNSPYGFQTDWADPDSFTGRYITTDGELQVFDASTVFGLQVTPNFGIGAGAIYRTSEFSFGRRLPGFNINTGQIQDIGSLAVETDMDSGIGWTAGFLHKIGKNFSWGASYRSPIEIDYAGAGKLTQILTGNTLLDQLNRATLPYDVDLPMTTTISFPDTATLGVAIAPTKKLLVAVDVTQTGWSNFEGLALTFPANAIFNQTLQGPWEDALSYRLGFQLTMSKGIEWRFGYAFEESPQPDASVAPLLPDAERSIVSAGFGRDWLDIGFQFIAPSSRTTRTNPDLLNGTYSGNSYLLAVSMTKK